MRAGRLNASLDGDCRTTPGDQPTSLGPARRRSGRPHCTGRRRTEFWRTDASTNEELWDAAAGCYDEKQLAAIILMIAVTNLFNRLNATIRQVAGAWG